MPVSFDIQEIFKCDMDQNKEKEKDLFLLQIVLVHTTPCDAVGALSSMSFVKCLS